ncbi:MAG: hypothetical protein L3J50_05750, partial [Emcibacter sp.]|nr:hypothetical protein [Emcibacter sp.]
MTKQTNSDALQFVKKKANPVWGNTLDKDGISPDHIVQANVLVLHPHHKKRPSKRLMALPSLRSPQACLEEA